MFIWHFFQVSHFTEVFAWILSFHPHNNCGYNCSPSATDLKRPEGATVVAQWLGIHPPMQETRVQALVWEDPTCHRANKPVRHNY